MEQGIYWKKGAKSDYAGVEILGDSGVIPRAVIEEIVFHESLKVQGKTESERWTCKFQGVDKLVLLNSTNRRRIAKRFWDTPVADGTPCHGRINLLSGMGLAVRLDSEPCRDPSDGTMTVGLRVSLLDPAPAPAPAAKKVIKEDQIQKIVDWAKQNKLSIEKIAEKYDFESDTVKQAIIDALDDIPE
jgi:hypothetical protein